MYGGGNDMYGEGMKCKGEEVTCMGGGGRGFSTAWGSVTSTSRGNFRKYLTFETKISQTFQMFLFFYFFFTQI